MKTTKSARGFTFILSDDEERIVSESSAVGDYEDSFDIPGSSYLWVGDTQLNREDIAKLRDALSHWLENKSLPEL